MIRFMMCGAAMLAAGCEDRPVSGFQRLAETDSALPSGAYIDQARYSVERDQLCANIIAPRGAADGPLIAIHDGATIELYTAPADGPSNAALRACEADDMRPIVRTHYRSPPS